MSGAVPFFHDRQWIVRDGGVGPRCRRQDGFTLLELLVALVLFSLVMLMLTGALHFAMQVWNRTESDEGFELIATQGFLRRVLSEARPVVPDPSRKAKLQTILFTGDLHDVRFVAPMPSYLGLGGLYELFIAQHGDAETGNTILFSWRLFRRTGHSFASSIRWRSITLLSGVKDVSFAYLGENGQWQSGWENTRKLPRLIRLSVDFDSPRRVWPVLIVAPQVGSMGLIITPDEL